MIVCLNDRCRNVVNTNKIKRMSMGYDYPNLPLFDLKIDDITIGYDNIEDREKDFNRLIEAMKGE